jgi:hypothetical protein
MADPGTWPARRSLDSGLIGLERSRHAATSPIQDYSLPEILTPDLLWFRDAISETLPART